MKRAAPEPFRPPAYLVTDRKRVRGDLVDFLARALDAGVTAIQIREKDLPAGELERLVERAVRRAGAWPAARILVNDRLDAALAADAAGVHLPAAGLPVAAVRRVVRRGFLVGASAHDLEEARAAESGGADFLVFGPVYPTPSKPDAAPRGLAELGRVAAAVRLPIYALGGVTPARVPEVLAAGAAGVAGISVFVSEASRRSLLDALEREKEGS